MSVNSAAAIFLTHQALILVSMSVPLFTFSISSNPTSMSSK